MGVGCSGAEGQRDGMAFVERLTMSGGASSPTADQD